ncbi:hypothetical protein M413DRAFT_344094 [Hebeloma cylindrosporum]|uniref:F-box domain-containing protein n=1 Tax=Hebeloma cylindrosporum TaxID=76867 RepID=A0A0C3CP86_HEBCY|nr:hypothetical protein M413DRAFT_344094 [Hebeloma cylindrosporum h7]
MDAEACSAPSNSTDRDRCFIGMIPIEIITELLTNLDFRDIFRVRKTCKLLRRAANMPKPYWVNLLYQHAWSGHPPLPLPIPIPFPLPLSLKLKLERPLDLYSAEELERVALQWITADMGWPNPVRQRTIVSTPRLGEGAAAPSAVLQHHLVEGGRWLIVVTDTGTVSYFDLEHEDGTRGRVLVHGQIPSGRGVRICMDVDVDAEEPVLTFNIGLDITERPGWSLFSVSPAVIYSSKDLVLRT